MKTCDRTGYIYIYRQWWWWNRAIVWLMADLGGVPNIMEIMEVMEVMGSRWVEQ